MGKTNIAWATDVWNPVVGCSKVSAGCAHCYAEKMAYRLRCMGRPEYQDVVDDQGHWTCEVRLCPERLKEPEHWRARRRVFVCSMSDLFHDAVPDGFVREVFDVMAFRDDTVFIVLTKRAARMAEWSAMWWGEWPRNVWAMVSAENQEAAHERIPDLLRVRAAVHGVSIEPMLGPVNLCNLDLSNGALLDALAGDVKTRTGEIYAAAPSSLSWVIVGAESGPRRRPFDPAWAMDVYDQCKTAGVTVFLKQGSGARPGTPLLVDGREVHEWPEGCDA